MHYLLLAICHNEEERRVVNLGEFGLFRISAQLINSGRVDEGLDLFVAWMNVNKRAMKLEYEYYESNAASGSAMF